MQIAVLLGVAVATGGARWVVLRYASRWQLLYWRKASGWLLADAAGRSLLVFITGASVGVASQTPWLGMVGAVGLASYFVSSAYRGGLRGLRGLFRDRLVSALFTEVVDRELDRVATCLRENQSGPVYGISGEDGGPTDNQHLTRFVQEYPYDRMEEVRRWARAASGWSLKTRLRLSGSGGSIGVYHKQMRTIMRDSSAAAQASIAVLWIAKPAAVGSGGRLSEGIGDHYGATSRASIIGCQ